MTKNNSIDTAFILCGGRGTRLGHHTKHLPKPMMECNGKPFLSYIIRQAAGQGISNFVLGTGYLKSKIRDYFGNGSSLGVNIEYSEGADYWDTGRRLWEAKSMLPSSFMILYGDNFTSFDIKQSLANFSSEVALTLLVTKCQNGEYKTLGNIRLEHNDVVRAYSTVPQKEGFSYVEIGYMLVRHDLFFSSFKNANCSLSSVLEHLAKSRRIKATISQKPYYWITDSQSWQHAEACLKEYELQ